MSEHASRWERIIEWWHLLWHHAKADTLPRAPAPGDAPVTIPPVGGTITPPAPPLPVPSAHDLPAGVAWADDANKLVSIAALEQYYPGDRYAVKQAEDFVTPGSAAFYGLVQNIQNCTFAEAHDMIQYGVFHPAKPNGLTNGYSLDTAVTVPHVFVCPDKYPTFDAVIAWRTATAQANAANPHNADGGAGFIPHQQH